MHVLDYDILESIHKGSTSDVYKVKRRKDQQMVCMKIIRKDKIEERDKCQITRETEILSRINHPNIIRLYTSFEDPFNVFIIMDYYTSGNLYMRLFIQNFTEKETIRYIKQLLRAIEYLHSKNIIHRDIKSENILLTENDDIILCDFGWSVISPSLRTTQCGTLEYFSPEIVLNRSYDKSIDLWTVGILTYELLTCVTPFEIDQEAGIQRNIYENIVNIRYDFPSFISSSAQNFIKSLLRYSNLRMSLEDAIRHEWLN